MAVADVDEVVLDARLISELMLAVKEPDKWQDVLSYLMTATGAGAAMITLRDSATCQIVDDVALEQTYHSPLICGFSEESAIYYLQELRRIDPWAKAQREYYPHHPIMMSKVCDPAMMPNDKFFRWLGDLGFAETVVFELDRMPGNWTAMNLFIKKAGGRAAAETLRYVECHFRVMRDVWQASQAMVQNFQSMRASLDQISASACIVNHSGEVISQNSGFSDLISKGCIELHGPKRRLSFADSISVEPKTMPSLSIRRHSGPDEKMHAFAARFDPDPLHKEKRTGYHLVIVRNGDAGRHVEEFDNVAIEALSSQEKRMLNAVQSGLGVREAGEIVGVRRTRAFEIWSSVKSKLSIGSSHQIRKS